MAVANNIWNIYVDMFHDMSKDARSYKYSKEHKNAIEIRNKDNSMLLFVYNNEKSWELKTIK